MSILKLNYNTAVFKLCFDTDISGVIAGRRLCEPIPFSDLSEMFLKLDYIMDGQDYPRAFQRKRQFEQGKKTTASVPYANSAEEMMTPEAVEGMTGRRGTLLLQVMTRQNATWQGSLTYGNERRMFESVLQLIADIGELLS